MTLSATNNSYGGSTTVSLGTLAVTNTGALPRYSSSSTISVSNNAMLTLSVGGAGWTGGNVNSLLNANGGGFASGSFLGIDTTNGNFTYSNSIGGGMGLAKVGPNSLVLTASNAYTGLTSITAGTLQLGNGNSGNDGSVSGNINNNAVLAYDLYGPQTYAGVINGSGSLNKTGSGAFDAHRLQHVLGTTTISGGTLQLGSGSSGNDGSILGNINNNAALVYNLYGPQIIRRHQRHRQPDQDWGGHPYTLGHEQHLHRHHDCQRRHTCSHQHRRLPGYGTSSKLTVNNGGC